MRRDQAEPGAWPVSGLAAVALAAAALHQLVLLVPVAVITLVPVALLNNRFFWIVGGIAFVFLAWLVQPSAPARMRTLSREQAPRLYAHVDAMTDAIGAPRLHAIALDAQLNAGALEEHRGVSLRPTRRVLFLGLPMLRLLDTAAAEAVIAHELGHFSRRHGRLGHWLYRTREAWADWSDRVSGDEQESSPWERAGANFASVFLPWFRRISEAHSRRCEFEADALAAKWSSPQAAARALLLMELAAMRQDGDPEGLDLTALRSSAQPPSDWAERPARALMTRAVAPEELSEAMRHRQPRGSHPPHRQRIEAMGVDARDLDLNPAPWRESAASNWLGDMWECLCAELGPWSAPVDRMSWAMAHAALAAVPATEWPAVAAGQNAGTAVVEEDERAVAASRSRRLQRLSMAAEAIEQGRVNAPSSIDAWRQEALAAALAINPAIGQAWLVDVPVEKGQPVCGLVLRIDPREMESQSVNLDQATRSVALSTALLLPTDRDCWPRPSYTTEGLPPELQTRLEAMRRLKG